MDARRSDSTIDDTRHTGGKWIILKSTIALVPWPLTVIRRPLCGTRVHGTDAPRRLQLQIRLRRTVDDIRLSVSVRNGKSVARSVSIVSYILHNSCCCSFIYNINTHTIWWLPRPVISSRSVIGIPIGTSITIRHVQSARLIVKLCRPPRKHHSQ